MYYLEKFEFFAEVLDTGSSVDQNFGESLIFELESFALDGDVISGFLDFVDLLSCLDVSFFEFEDVQLFFQHIPFTRQLLNPVQIGLLEIGQGVNSLILSHVLGDDLIHVTCSSSLK